MAHQTLEERVAGLEQLVATLMNGPSAQNPPTDWWRSVGLFAGDKAMKRIDAAGQAIRQKERQRARRHRAPARANRK